MAIIKSLSICLYCACCSERNSLSQSMGFNFYLWLQFLYFLIIMRAFWYSHRLWCSSHMKWFLWIITFLLWVVHEGQPLTIHLSLVSFCFTVAWTEPSAHQQVFILKVSRDFKITVLWKIFFFSFTHTLSFFFSILFSKSNNGFDCLHVIPLYCSFMFNKDLILFQLSVMFCQCVVVAVLITYKTWVGLGWLSANIALWSCVPLSSSACSITGE